MNAPPAEILVVDDEADITDLIRLYLEKEGFTVHTAHHGDQAIRMAESLVPDLVILDVLLGIPDGIEVCRALRAGACACVPILFLSAKSEDNDIITGLAEGGDDYMTKPFSPSQLVARVHAHLRRRRSYDRKEKAQKQPQALSFPRLSIDFRSLEVRKDNVKLPLSAKEFELLAVLTRQPDRVFPLDELYKRVWQSESIGDTRTLMVHISNLRKKIEDDPARPRWIRTVRGFGYRFHPNAGLAAAEGESSFSN